MREGASFNPVGRKRQTAEHRGGWGEQTNNMSGAAGRPRPSEEEPRPLPSPPVSAYIIGAAGAAAFFAVRRFAGFFAALRAGFRVAFLATFRFAVFFFAAGLRPVFFAVLRAGFLAAALRTVVLFFATFLRAGFLFAVIGM
jgi:hypothetical protein